MAALSAAKEGGSVLILERNCSPCVKLGLTGNGRCNITNAAPLNSFVSHVNKGQSLLKTALRVFFRPQLFGLFKPKGISFSEEDNGRIFPVETGARGLGQILVELAKEAGCEIKCGTIVKELLLDKCEIAKVKYVSGGQELIANCDAVVLCAGGISRPDTGSDGSGINLAEVLGHKIVSPAEALVPLLCDGTSSAAGASFADAVVKIIAEGRTASVKRGSVLFTHTGLSGPAILNISGTAARLVNQGKSVTVTIDPFPDIDEKTLDTVMLNFISSNGTKTVRHLAEKFLPHSIAILAIDKCELSGEVRCADMPASSRKNLRTSMKPFSFTVTGNAGADIAMSSSGGVAESEVDPKTMRSKKSRNLFFAGEVLDIDADTGGFNLHIAMATGNLAGRSAVRDLDK